MRSWIVTTRRKRPQTGAVLARLCSRSTPARRASREQLLLAAHPLDAIERPHRDLHRVDEIGPRTGRPDRVAVDEGREPVLGRGRHQLGDELAGDGLGPAGGAGGEVDEVEAHVHGRGGYRRHTALPALTRCARGDLPRPPRLGRCRPVDASEIPGLLPHASRGYVAPVGHRVERLPRPRPARRRPTDRGGDRARRLRGAGVEARPGRVLGGRPVGQ